MQVLKQFTNFLSDLKLIESRRNFTLPRIAILGTPKSGKTCLLESFVGLALFEENMNKKLKYIEVTTKTSDSLNEFKIVFENTEETFYNAQLFCEKFKNYISSIRDDYSEIIKITITGYAYPKWTLIELPGLAYIDPNNTNEIFLEEESMKKKIVKKIIKDESTLILCVVSALEEIVDSRVLEYAREYDSSGDRTFGVVTMYDIVEDPILKKNVSKVLSGGLMPLKHGYESINPKFSRVETTIKDIDENHKDIRGPVALDIILRKIKKVQCYGLRTKLPGLLNDFILKSKEYEDELEELGEDLDIEKVDTFKYLWKKSNEFCTNFINALSGSYVAKTKKNQTMLSCGAYIRSLFHHMYRQEDFNQHFEAVTYSDEEIKDVIKNHNCVSLDGFITAEAFKMLTFDKLQHLEKPSYIVFDKIHESIVETSVSLLEKHFARLPDLKAKLEEILEDFYKQKKLKTIGIIKPLIDAELSCFFCNDPEKVFQNVYTLARNDQEAEAVNKGDILDRMISELRNSCKMYCESVLMSLRELLPKLIGQYYLNSISSETQIFLTQKINALTKENPSILRLTQWKKEERAQIQTKLKSIQKLKTFMSQDTYIYQFLRDPTVEENIYNKYLKRKEEYHKRAEENLLRARNQPIVKVEKVPEKKKGNIFKRFQNWIKTKSKKKKPIPKPEVANQPVKMKYPGEEFTPDEFVIKRIRASSLDNKKKKEETDAQQIISDFVLIEDYYYQDQDVQNTILSKKEIMIAIDKGELSLIDPGRLEATLQHGLPNESRASMWSLIVDMKRLKAAYPKMYYERVSKQNTSWEELIGKDGPRTFTKEDFFRRPEYQAVDRLKRVLRAYANHDTDLGYTQGMNCVAAIFLMVFSNYGNDSKHKDVSQISKSAEKNAFWMMVYIMKNKNFREMFVDNCPMLLEYLFKFEKILQDDLPDIAKHMEDNGILVHGCFAHYFLTVCSQTSPIEFSKRIMDVFLYSGVKVIFDVLQKVMIACKKEILNTKGEHLFNFLKSEMMHVCFEKYKKELNQVLPGNDIVESTSASTSPTKSMIAPTTSASTILPNTQPNKFVVKK